MKPVWCWAGPTSRVLAHKPPTRRNLSQKLSDDVFFYSCPDAQMPPKKDDKKKAAAGKAGGGGGGKAKKKVDECASNLGSCFLAPGTGKKAGEELQLLVRHLCAENGGGWQRERSCPDGAAPRSAACQQRGGPPTHACMTGGGGGLRNDPISH